MDGWQLLGHLPSGWAERVAAAGEVMRAGDPRIDDVHQMISAFGRGAVPWRILDRYPPRKKHLPG